MDRSSSVTCLNNFVQIELGIKHRCTTPYWPEANAEIERFFRTLKNFLIAVNVERKNWRNELFRFLLSYRTTPHCSTGKAPCELLMNRILKTKIPDIANTPQNPHMEEAVKKDKVQKEKAKIRVDKKTKESQIKEGDKVLILQEKKNKLTPNFDPDPYLVIRRTGSALVLKRSNSIIRRNVAHARIYMRCNASVSNNDSDTEPEDELDTEGIAADHTAPDEAPLALQRPERIRRRPTYLDDYITD